MFVGLFNRLCKLSCSRFSVKRYPHSLQSQRCALSPLDKCLKPSLNKLSEAHWGQASGHKFGGLLWGVIDEL
jgi:hypothetical protein